MDATMSMPLWLAVLIIVLAGGSLWIGWKIKTIGNLLRWLLVSIGVGFLVPFVFMLLLGTWESGLVRISLAEPVRVVIQQVGTFRSFFGGRQTIYSTGGEGIIPTSTPVYAPSPQFLPAPTQAPQPQSSTSGYPSCQEVLNSFADVYGRQNYWARVVSSGVQSCADSPSARSAPFTQPEKLPVEVANCLSWPVVATAVPMQDPLPTPTIGPPSPTATPDPFVEDQEQLNEYWREGDRAAAEQYCRLRNSDACNMAMSQIAEETAQWQRLTDYLVDTPRPGDAIWLEGVAERLPKSTYRTISLGWGKWQIQVVGEGWISGLRTEVPRQFLSAIGHKSDGEIWPFFPR